MRKILLALLLLMAGSAVAEPARNHSQEAVQIVANVMVPDEMKLAVQTRSEPTSNPGGLSDTLMTVLITALIAGLFPLLTTIVMNCYAKKSQAANNKQALDMLEADNKAKADEAVTARKFQLRQELYLRSVKVVVDMNGLFTSYLRQEDPKDIKVFLDFNKTITEIQLVGDSQTVTAAYALQNEIGKKFMALMAVRGAIEQSRRPGPSTMDAVIESHINAQHLKVMREIVHSRELMAELQWNMKRELGVEGDLHQLKAEVRNSWRMALTALEEAFGNKDI